MGASQLASADLINGTFEDGLTGWTTTVNGLAKPVVITSGVTNTSAGTLQPSLTNDNYAYTSQNGPGSSFLTQTFEVQSGTNKIYADITVINNAADYHTPNTLDYTVNPNQQARFDILRPGASLTTMDPADIIATGFQTLPGDPTTQAWRTVEIDATGQLAAYVGQNVIFRFSQVDNQSFFNLAIDNVNVGASQIAQILSVLASATAQQNLPAYAAARVIDDNPDLQAQFVGMSGDDGAISDAVTQTLPLLMGATPRVIYNTLSNTNRIIHARLGDNIGMNSGDETMMDKHSWIKAFVTRHDQDDRDGVSGFDGDSKGLVLGIDGDLNDRTKLGIAFAFSNTDITGNTNLNSADIDSYQVVGYGSYAINDRTEVNFQAGLGLSKIDGKRIMIAPVTGTANADYDSTSFNLGMGIGKTFDLSPRTQIVPLARIDYTRVDSDSYTETGDVAVTPFLNQVNANRAEALELGLGAKLRHQVNDKTSINADLGVAYDTFNERSAITSSFVGGGPSFTTSGIKPDPWIRRAGLGLTYALQNGAEVIARYDAEVRDDFNDQSASLKVRWAF